MLQKFDQKLREASQRESVEGRVNVSGMTKIQGSVIKQTNFVDKDEYSDYIFCLKDQIAFKYPQKEAKVILNVISKSNNKLEKEFSKNWLIFLNEQGKMSYFGFLKREKDNKILVGIYEFKVNFTLTKDIFIKRSTCYYEQSDFFGTDSIYVSIDTEEHKSRGITKQDLHILLKYSDLIEMEFQDLDFL